MIREDYLESLNLQQREAVEYMSGPQLIIAGAGSGKTRVLMHKIVHLLNLGYAPTRILALTFTNKAADSMKDRINALTGEKIADKLWMGTFHSILLRILYRHYDKIGFRSDFTIYDTADSRSLIRMIIKDMQLDEKAYKPSNVLSAISFAKNNMVSPDEYAASRELTEADRRAKMPLLYAIYRQYSRRCNVANALDFDDILYFSNKLFEENKDVLDYYRNYFRYVLVDEYQDTNKAQNMIICHLTKGKGNLSVVGDDAQSIYAFRGANIYNILNLKENYPDLQIHKLERNYRSTKNIIEAANALINNNNNQIPKHLFSENEAGEPIRIVECYNDMEEGFLVSNTIAANKIKNKDSFSDYAVLYRNNAQSRILEEMLRKRNIPYRIYGSLSFYQRKEIKDIIAYLRMTVNPDDDESFRRVINYPGRGIGDTTLGKLTSIAFDKGISLWRTLEDAELDGIALNRGLKTKLRGFRELLSDFIERHNRGANAFELASYIINRTGILNALITDKTPESISKQENINELLNGINVFVETRMDEGREKEVSLVDFLGEISLIGETEDDSTLDSDFVTLTTVHSAKGLEFKHVIIVGVEEELFPSSRSYNSHDGLEEERRLMYVAVTRAKKTCLISYTKNRFKNGEHILCRPSRFINEIRCYKNKIKDDTSKRSQTSQSIPYISMTKSLDPNLSGGKGFVTHTLNEVYPGDIIEHSLFGRGEILSVGGETIKETIRVRFDKMGEKTLLLNYARFRILSK